MSYNLYICEKPSQAKDLARNLHINTKRDGHFISSDNQTIITWCLGHLLELSTPEAYDPNYKFWRINQLPIIPSTWKYEVSKKTAPQYKIVSQLIKGASLVTIATDYDREGEAIARNLLNRARYKGPIKRLCLTALDDKSIQRALHNILDGSQTQCLYEAAIARSHADWVVGMNLTRLFTLLLKGSKTVISVGRVQTPTVTLVVERDNAIKNFVPKPYYNLFLDVYNPSANAGYRVKWVPKEEYVNEEGLVINKEIVDNIAKKMAQKILTVTDYTNKISKQQPMLPYDLTSLQQFCNKSFGFSAATTLSIAQSLYEKHKATSYPRTDCRYLPNSQFGDVPEILRNLASQDPEAQKQINGATRTQYPSRAFDQSKITAHHAIIPTGAPNVDIHKMSDSEYKVYNAIRKAYIAQFYPAAEYNCTSISLTGENENFKANSKVLVNPGWRILYGADIDNNKKEEKQDGDEFETTGFIPPCNVGDKHPVQNSFVESKMTTPPSHFTEATLLSAMENIHRYITEPKWKKMLKETSGLGTPATRASIIDSVIDRGYLERSGKNILSTEKALFMTKIIPADIRSAGMTAVWEQALDSIAKGTMDPSRFMDSITRWIAFVVEQNANNSIETPAFSATTSTSSQTRNSRTSSTSSRRKKAPTTKNVFANSASNETAQGTSSTTRSKTTRTTRARKGTSPKTTTRSANKNINTANNVASTSNSNAPTCPKCGKIMILRHNKTTNEAFYGCSGFPNCRSILKVS